MYDRAPLAMACYRNWPLPSTCLTSPEAYERALSSVKRIGRRQRHFGFGSSLPLHIEVRLSWRVGADHFQSVVVADATVTCTSGKHQHVARLESEQPASL